MARGLPTGGQGSKVYVLCAEPKEHKHSRPGTRRRGLGTRPGGSVTGVTEKLFMCPMFIFRPLSEGVARNDTKVHCKQCHGHLDSRAVAQHDQPGRILSWSGSSETARQQQQQDHRKQIHQAPKKGVNIKNFARNPPPSPPPKGPPTPVCLGPPFSSKRRKKPKHKEFLGGGS